jgi:SAM-dependent methyltransferase
LIPWGTRKNNSRNRRFNQKLYHLFGEQRGPMWVMDLGCAGGGFVKECLDDGCVAVGLEGSDYSKKLRRAEWRTIPEFLFTADITATFEVIGEFVSGEKRIQFDAITSWEVMEHIRESDLPMVVENIKRHLRPGGLWITSITPVDDIVQGVNLHQTVKPRQWWSEKLEKLGLICAEEYVHYFNGQFVRGPKYFAHPSAFHLVLTNDRKLAPPLPREGLATRIYDAWLGSFLQQALYYGVCGVDRPLPDQLVK